MPPLNRFDCQVKKCVLLPPKAHRELIKALNRALPGTHIDTPMLGIYCAMMLTNPFIIELMQENPYFDRGFGRYNNVVTNAIEDILEYLANYLSNDCKYIISEDDLNNIGKLVLRIKSNMV